MMLARLTGCGRNTQPIFRAASRGRHALARIEQAERVEGSLDGVELAQFLGRELDAHLIDLLDAHAMLAGDGAADLDAQFQQASAQFLGALQFAGLVGVEQDQRMQVAVAGMEDIGHAQSVFLGQLGGAPQHLGQGAARDGAVHAVVVG